MNDENFVISKLDIDAFKNACDDSTGVVFKEYKNGRAYITYYYAHSLFYLGQIYSLKK